MKRVASSALRVHRPTDYGKLSLIRCCVVMTIKRMPLGMVSIAVLKLGGNKAVSVADLPTWHRPRAVRY